MGAIKFYVALIKVESNYITFCNNRICINSFAFNEVFVNVGFSS